ncbi:DUF262 domain-containing protein [Spartobacteria bacterium LR76]|nr:DUF262 domain-containing protein [Spartobacteria bacterium LR76]
MSAENQPEIREETDENSQPTGIEFEEQQTSQPPRPYDPEKIRVDPKMFSLRQILDMIDDGDLELAPDFQRLKVWTALQKSRLIESVLLRIPLPAFYFSSDSSGKLQVVDGLQRLSTIHDYVKGGKNKDAFFKLENLEYLTDQVGGRTYSALELESPTWIRRIKQTQIIANVIDPQTPNKVKFDIFRRINTGGSPLNSQEIRHCLSKQQSRDILKELSASSEFLHATRGLLTGNVRMIDREVILRFCAFYKYPGFLEYSSHESMDSFLNQATELLDSLPKNDLDSLAKSFKSSMKKAYHLFGNHAFRKWPINTDNILPFNRALFDVWSVALTKYTEKEIFSNATQIVTEARKITTYNNDFIQSITAGTSDTRKVITRFVTIFDLLASLI